MSRDPATRRAIAQRAIDRAKSRGAPIDENPIFMALLDAWISGDIDNAVGNDEIDLDLRIARHELRKSRRKLVDAEAV